METPPTSRIAEVQMPFGTVNDNGTTAWDVAASFPLDRCLTPLPRCARAGTLGPWVTEGSAICRSLDPGPLLCSRTRSLLAQKRRRDKCSGLTDDESD